MTLDRLRSYRRTLLEEELRASYWRRLLQGRRDLLRSDSDSAAARMSAEIEARLATFDLAARP